MKRRHFIKNTGIAIGLQGLLGGMSIKAQAGPYFLNRQMEASDRVLVLVRLSGGNDGLNTLIPIDQHRNLHHARSNISLPVNKLLPVRDNLGFHPAMTGMKSLYDEGRLKIIQSAGYPDQNRSHFRSMEIWQSGLTDRESRPSEVNTGWLGRYLDYVYPGFPESYSGGANSDPFAISMGHFASETCQGSAANFSMALDDPFSLTPMDLGEELGNYPSFFREELEYVQLMMGQSNQYFDRITKAAGKGNSLAAYPDTELARQLKNVALLISGGLKTKIYFVDLGGFDTHNRQAEESAPETGRHAELLQTLSDAVNSFQNDLRKLGLENRVMGMTFSEFGRQIASNGGRGTDHGEAAPLFLFGACVNPQIIGDNPTIPEEVKVQEAVPMQIDFRNVYGSILENWFKVPAQDVKQIIYPDYNPLSLFGACDIISDTENPQVQQLFDIYNYPNPFREKTTIHFRSGDHHVELSVTDSLGRVIRVLTDQRLPAGSHQVEFDSGTLPAGTYYYRLIVEQQRQLSGQMIKIR